MVVQKSCKFLNNILLLYQFLHRIKKCVLNHGVMQLGILQGALYHTS